MFIVIREDMAAEFKTEEEKKKLQEMRDLIKLKKVNAMLGKQKVPSNIEGMSQTVYSFIIVKDGIKWIESYAKTAAEAVELVTTFLNNHTVEEY